MRGVYIGGRMVVLYAGAGAGAAVLFQCGIAASNWDHVYGTVAVHLLCTRRDMNGEIFFYTGDVAKWIEMQRQGARGRARDREIPPSSII